MEIFPTSVLCINPPESTSIILIFKATISLLPSRVTKNYKILNTCHSYILNLTVIQDYSISK